MAVILDGNFIETKELFILKIAYLQEASKMAQRGAAQHSLRLFHWVILAVIQDQNRELGTGMKCLGLHYFITCADSCGHHYSQYTELFPYLKNLLRAIPVRSHPYPVGTPPWPVPSSLQLIISALTVISSFKNV